MTEGPLVRGYFGYFAACGRATRHHGRHLPYLQGEIVLHMHGDDACTNSPSFHTYPRVHVDVAIDVVASHGHVHLERIRDIRRTGDRLQ